MAIFSQELFDNICHHIGEGRSLRSICAQKDMPSTTSFMKWVDTTPELAQQYARAMESRSEHMFEEILDIADNAGEDIIILQDGREVTNHEAVSRDKLRVETRKWMLGKMHPKKYGDKQQIDHTTQGEKLSSTLEIRVVPMDKLPDTDK